MGRRNSIVKPIAKFETFFWFVFVLGLLIWVFNYHYLAIAKYGIIIGGVGIVLLKLAKLLKI